MSKKLPHLFRLIVWFQGLILLFAAGVLSADELVLDNNILLAPLATPMMPHAKVLEDQNDALKVVDVLGGNYDAQFVQPSSFQFNLRYSLSTFWVRFDLLNRSESIEWYIDFLGSTLSLKTELYISNDGSNDFSKLRQLSKTGGQNTGWILTEMFLIPFI